MSDKETPSMSFLILIKLKVILTKQHLLLSPSVAIAGESGEGTASFPHTRRAFSLPRPNNDQEHSSLYITGLALNSQATCGPVTIQVPGFIPNYTSDVQRNIGHITSHPLSFSVLIKYRC